VKQPPKNYSTVENENVAGFFAIGHKRSGVAGFKVYEAGRPTNNENLEVQNGRVGGILGSQGGID
jgi:hypothetical protein